MHRDFWYNGCGNGGCSQQKSKPPLNGDRDSALLIALLFILLSDGGDEMLIMALLYILS